MTLLSTFNDFPLSLAGIPASGAVSALPASEEYAENYAVMTCQFEEAEKGKMSLALRAARNHAAVVSASPAQGWMKHDKTYPAVLK